MRIHKYILILTIFSFAFLFTNGCDYVTHRTFSGAQEKEDEDPEPNYDISLDRDYQEFVTYMFPGNRAETFGAFFNKFYSALEDYDEAMVEYRTSTITSYNRRLDSLNITPPLSTTAKEKFNKVLERCSKVIQFNKNTMFLDDAVLLIGKSYYYMTEYLQAERKFSEFLSKLTKSPLSDEAILFLGRTKIKLRKTSEGETILNNLLKTTADREIKSEITQELAQIEISKNNYKEAIKYFENSIEFTKDKEKKAEKQYILSKIYTVFGPKDAYKEYDKVINFTSDFDLTFYAKLNKAKALLEIKKFNEANEILESINNKYRDYPELKQLAEFEIANTLYSQNKFSKAKIKYFDIIINYPGTKSAAESYYYLAQYAENTEMKYIDAYVNYKKSSETNANSDFHSVSVKKVSSLDKYFDLFATYRGIPKIELPTENKEFEKYKAKIEKEKGIEPEKQKGNEQGPKEPETPKGPKGGGYYSYKDTLDPKKINEGIKNVKDSLDSGKLKEGIKDGEDDVKGKTKDIKKGKNKNDSTLIINNKQDSLNVIINEDSLLTVKESSKYIACIELAELFLYELGRTDSTLYYLNIAATESKDSNLAAKSLYLLATIYKNQNNDEKATNTFKKIISEYPLTIFANESRKALGLQMIEIEKDSAEFIYKDAEKNIRNQNYESALNSLRTILLKYPETNLRPKVLYTTGWIFENTYNNKDSALEYYKRIKKEFPNSEYSTALTDKLEFFASQEKKETPDSNKVNPDSTLIKNDSLNVSSDSTITGKDSTGNIIKNIEEKKSVIIKKEENPTEELNEKKEEEIIKKEEKPIEEQNGKKEGENVEENAIPTEQKK